MDILDYSNEDFPVDNLPLFNERLSIVSKRLGLEKESLGKVFGHDIWLIRPKIFNGPKLLFAAGFHGEEPAGVWGTLHFLENADPKLLQQATVSFLPLVNPSGIAAKRRYNDAGENPNSYYCHAEPETTPSQEGKLLLAHLPLLISLAEKSFISLHEDCDLTKFYVYTFERTLGPFSKKLLEIESRFFSPASKKEIPDQPLINGLIYNFCDGSFEDRLYHEGVPHTACTETPGKERLDVRVTANAAIIDGMIRHFINEKTDN